MLSTGRRRRGAVPIAQHTLTCVTWSGRVSSLAMLLSTADSFLPSKLKQDGCCASTADNVAVLPVRRRRRAGPGTRCSLC